MFHITHEIFSNVFFYIHWFGYTSVCRCIRVDIGGFSPSSIDYADLGTIFFRSSDFRPEIFVSTWKKEIERERERDGMGETSKENDMK